MSYAKEVVKENITLDDVAYLLDFLGAEPDMFSDYITAKTICHGGDSHKLYYYNNTQLFKCYSGECGTFDIFELIQRVKNIDLNSAIYFVVNFLNLQGEIAETDESELTDDWKILKVYDKLLEDKDSISAQHVKLPAMDPDILQFYPQPRYKNWEAEYITKDVCDYMNIRYNPVTGSILIPHYDVDNNLIGIRERTLVKANEALGKYRPAIIQNKMRNHPLAFNLYGLNKSRPNIQKTGVAIVLEGEKAVLQTISYLGTENNIAVAMCGSSLSKYQFNLLLESGAKEIVIGFDKDFHSFGDEESETVIHKIEKVYHKYSPFCNISFLFDKDKILGYKNSPCDCGKDAFLYLWRNRIVI